MFPKVAYHTAASAVLSLYANKWFWMPGDTVCNSACTQSIVVTIKRVQQSAQTKTIVLQTSLFRLQGMQLSHVSAAPRNPRALVCIWGELRGFSCNDS
eukprot:4797854-Amphidinium_carterae.1